jgi:MinD superfamily P-loop ATPase
MISKVKSIAVVSGKGGTGKTSITAAIAQLAKSAVIADCDVDAADLHLLLTPEIKEHGAFHSGHIAVIDYDICTSCGACKEACAFSAIDDSIYIDPIACEGCGVCEFVCPVGAAKMTPTECGEWFVSETRVGSMVHARLYPGKENSGKLVSLVRKKSQDEASRLGSKLILIDGPPGVGCPVIASIGGVDLIIIVSEPTIAGMHDAERVLELAAHFKIKACMIINKHDLNKENTSDLEKMAKKKGADNVGMVPYDTDFTKAQLAGQTIVEYGEGVCAREIENIWNKVSKTITEVS